jgi:ATP-dependent Clp protease ATP-binding subunit ClpA
VGKTALCRELAWRWRQKEAGRTACRVDVPALLAGSSLPNQRNERFQTLYREARGLGPAALLVLEDLPFACTTGLTRLALCQAIDAGLRLCAATLPSGLLVLRDVSLRRRLHTIAVPQPGPEELAETILPAVARHLEIRYGVHVTREALALVGRAERGRGAQPGRAIRVLDGALARARQKGLTFLGPDDVLE